MFARSTAPAVVAFLLLLGAACGALAQQPYPAKPMRRHQLSARRSVRPDRAAARQQDAGRAETAAGRRIEAQGGRQHRRRRGGQERSRRLHAADDDRHAVQRQSGALPDDAVQGIGGVEFEVLYVMMAPVATPDGIVATLRREIAAALAQPDVQETLRAADLAILDETGAPAKARLASARERYAATLRSTGMKLG